MSYRGRFAPSPTGPLHFGSLVAALASYLDARAQLGAWLLRVEDLDPPREVAGASDAILRTLDTLGLHWDGPVVYQSARQEAYREAFDRLSRAGHTFACGCSRREMVDSVLAAGPGREVPYPGTCRHGLAPGRSARSWRLRVGEETVTFTDRVQGPLRQSLSAEVGDFVLRRADGLFAYQLAVVVDDAAESVSDVVRGADLLDSTPRQILLQRLLGFAEPRYLHVPVVVNADQQKMSKQTLAAPIDAARPARALRAALEFLGQAPPRDFAAADLLGWAVEHWSVEAIPRRLRAPCPRL